jgi:glycosyltransferase involved in cell wall biosynthesis
MPARVKILYLTPSARLLGARRSLLSLVSKLDGDRFSPTVVCPSHHGLAQELNDRGVRTLFAKHYPWRKGRYVLHRYYELFELRKLLRSEHFDIVHCNEIHSNIYAVKAAHGLPARVVTHVRLPVSGDMIQKYSLSKADRIIAVSRAIADGFAGWKHKNKVCVIYNGVDLAEFDASRVDREAARNQLGVAKEDILIGMIGLIGSRKRQHIALEALQRAASECTRCKLLIVGNATKYEKRYEENLHRRVTEYGLKSKVLFLPFQADIVKVYAALDVNLLIADEEGFGRVVIESGAMGVPTIGTNIGGIPEVIRDGETGFLIPLDASEALAKKMLLLARDEQLRRRMGEAARQFVRNNFSAEKHKDAIQQLYLELLRDNSQR